MSTITGSNDADVLLGTPFADSIDGLGGNDFIDGGAGNDTINGGSGNDTIMGNDGNDVITGGLGSDSVSGGAGDDRYLFNVTTDEADIVNLDAGNDLVVVTQNTSNVVRLTFNAAEAGNGSATGSDGQLAVNLQGTTNNGVNVFGLSNRFDDEGITFSVQGQPFLFDVRDGATQIGANFSLVSLGTSGADSFNGPTFNPAAGIYFNGGAGNDQVLGGRFADFLDGGAGNDTLIGGGGGDRIFGRDGDDTAQLNVSGVNPLATVIDGSDTIDLGAGNDIIRVSRLTPGEVRLTFRSSGVGNGVAADTVAEGGDGDLNVRIQGENGSGGLDAVDPISRADDEGVTFIGENGVRFDVRDITGVARGSFDIVQLGTSGADNIVAQASMLDRYFNGGLGNDTLRGGSGNDFLVGGGGDDLLVGGGGFDQYLAGDGADLILGSTGVDFVIDAGAGNDRVFGNTGNDTLNGGLGDDLINGEVGDDVLNGGDGNDLLSGELGNDIILGGNGSDVLIGGEGNDQLNGEADNDLLFGGIGVDNLTGGTGNDGLNGEAGDDALNGGDGDDTLSGETGNDLLLGAAGTDLLLGGAGLDTLNGEAGDDFLFGEAGDDTLSGEAGADVLFGGGGGDVLIGGAGGDSFVFLALTDSGAGGRDLITDLTIGQDRIDLSQLDANANVAGNQAFTLVGAFSNVAGQITRTFDGAAGVTVFSGDVNGDGVSDFAFAVVGDFTTQDPGTFITL